MADTVIEVEPELEFEIIEPANTLIIRSIPHILLQYSEREDIKLEYTAKPKIKQTKTELIISDLEEGKVRLLIPFISHLELKETQNVEIKELNVNSLDIECSSELKIVKSITKSVQIISLGSTEIEKILGQSIVIHQKEGSLKINNLVSEELKLFGAFANFTLENLESLKTTIKANYGDLKVDLKSNEIDIEKKYGEAFCQLEYNSLILKSSYATLKLDLLQRDKSRITNSHGNINAVLKELNGKFELSAANGTISILKNGEPLTCTELCDDTGELKRGNLPGKGSFVAKVNYGKIRLDLE
ncbi:hypothetical protein HDV06_006316 [Boothiomyces sp. JEL0866]|nr:hypothetical protein HDV06_006316 [Boothiomyces sp. JEL0866]